MKIIKIFLASSVKMADSRKLFEIDINRRNKDWVPKGIFLDLIIWEDFQESMSKKGKQNEYDQSIAGCDIFVLLFSDKVGKYSKEEFDCAYAAFKESPKDIPRIYTYYIKSEAKTDTDLNTNNFIKYLNKLKHYPGIYNSFAEVSKVFFEQLNDLANTNPYFSFPDNKPRIIEKVQYIKLHYLANKENKREPVYKKFIDRLQKEEDIYDEAQFSELVIYSGVPDTNFIYNYSHSRGTIDMNIIVPKQEENTNNNMLHEDDTMNDTLKQIVDMKSNVFFSVTSFINAFQKGKTFYQTRADKEIGNVRLIIDLSSIPHCKELQISAPTAKRYNENKKGQTETVPVREIKYAVYQAEATELKEGDIVTMNFELDWDKIQ
ncbi:MAG: hypothetical protein ABI666_02150 [Ferruginibacter sp.]